MTVAGISAVSKNTRCDRVAHDRIVASVANLGFFFFDSEDQLIRELSNYQKKPYSLLLRRGLLLERRGRIAFFLRQRKASSIDAHYTCYRKRSL
ncbi:hypothetical protein Y032_0060g3174 [Ancylostoma ceylanicum]|uniref:Uncharacterized protein n=1 Tax=Ancylostoma ceylanicum TaxID=53326 RepID=A0A016U4N3_9BILA|nr:hypothetical protein Y032_0060g3174 [Ancylostoma ceylanicum]